MLISTDLSTQAKPMSLIGTSTRASSLSNGKAYLFEQQNRKTLVACQTPLRRRAIYSLVANIDIQFGELTLKIWGSSSQKDIYYSSTLDITFSAQKAKTQNNFYNDSAGASRRVIQYPYQIRPKQQYDHSPIIAFCLNLDVRNIDRL